ncbi:septal ring factor EnvC (AmiA/AmiB activator) [Roseovarius halotolerans]|uniref:Peptidase family M23 n=1 Tax=Roseovarius halotolerans TaxID=505353 RepID=A0A1X6YYB1_9RHOB|nr:peptidoglycan DD-metalloendopeptidase family protein [Roseovarius halotolerans]RKT32657.1 septal ring factor EnvC (AmiA/AmiB activator) [Roseovarius halotolerans]SLN34405.1 Peptidase family M23 [Roseovarius halotolerans]
MRLGAFLIGLMMASGAVAQPSGDPASDALAAADRLARAGALLEATEGAGNRVKALSETIRAYEDGLQAMREGLRRAAIREQTLSRELDAREDEVARLLGVLMAMGESPAPVLMLHPAGPVGTARSGMIVADVAPALNARADTLRVKLEEVGMLRMLQQSAADKLHEGLEGVQEARTALSQAIADRTDLPRRFTEDSVKTALLLASTDTLEGFASGLSEIAENEAPGSLPGIEDRKGTLALPVDGRILRRPGEADAAGISRPGVVLVTRPRALVTTPTAATVRYRGPLLDYGNVMILEPQSGFLLVLAGLDVVYGETGQVLPGGSPVGLMGGADGTEDVVLNAADQESGARQTETLYMELRENNTPVDPLEWFRTDKDD